MLLVGTTAVVLIAIVAILRMGLSRVRASLTVIAFGLALPALAMVAPLAHAADVENVSLATAGGYSVLGATTVTNTGDSVLAGSVGLHPGPSITGFPPGIVLPPAIIDTSATADQAQQDLTTAYNDAAGRSVNETTTADLVGLTLSPGVYSGPNKSALGLSGTLTLDGEDNPDAVFIFQTDSTLITGSASSVELINGAQACHVFWQVGSSATLGTGSTFVGTVLAQASVTVTSGVTVHGRALARTGAVTLDDDTFTDASCSQTGSTTTAGDSGTTTTLAGDSGTTTTLAGDSGTTTTTSGDSGTTTTTSGDSGTGSTTTTFPGQSSTTGPNGTFPGPSTSTGTGITTGTVPSGGPGTPGTTQRLARTGWPTTPLVLIGGVMVTFGLASLLIGRNRDVPSTRR